MEELQVPTRTILVDVLVTTGAHISGSMYVPDSPNQNYDADEVMHLLNDERSFVPLAVSGQKGGPFVLSKAHIVRVRIPLSESEAQDRVAESTPSDSSTSTLLLADGSVLEGTLAVVSPPSLSRLVDKLNSADRFLAVISTEAIDFAQRSHMVHIS